MKHLLLLVLTIICQLGISQSADFSLYERGSNLYMDVTIEKTQIDWIKSQNVDATADIADAFTIANYINENVTLLLDEKNVNFIVEGSVSNIEKIQITLKSEETYEVFGNLEMENNAFLAADPSWKNHIQLKFGESKKMTLTSDKNTFSEAVK